MNTFSEKVNKVEILNCNNNCQFCNIKKRKDLTTEGIKELMRLGKNDNDILHFGNGEIAIRNDFFDLINYGKQLGYKIIQIETNGRIFFYPKILDKVSQLGIDKFIIKFYSQKREIYEQITQAPGSFEQTVIGIKNLIKNHRYVVIELLINEFNYNEIPEIIEFLANLKVNQISFKIAKDFNNLTDQLIKNIKKGEFICANYGILIERKDSFLDQNLKEKYSPTEKKIKNKIDYLIKNNIIFIDNKLRNEIFKDIKLIDTLNFLRNRSQVVFHSSYEKFDKLIPHQGEAIYHHGNHKAVYAQADPYEAILRALKNKTNKNLGLCTSKKIKDNQYRFFAEEKVRQSFSRGYIHVLKPENFFYKNNEYYSFSSVVPSFIFEVNKNDFPYKLEPYPFTETKRKEIKKLFEDYERDIIREICLSYYPTFKNNKIHSYEHIYRVSELAFTLALNECKEFANEIFIGACLHDVGRNDDRHELEHGGKGKVIAKEIINKYFKYYYNEDVLEAIESHSLGQVSQNSIIGCLWDADRLDLLRTNRIPQKKFLSTKTARKILDNIAQKHNHDFEQVFANWQLHLDYFRRFLESEGLVGNKFFKKVAKGKFKELVELIYANYDDFGQLLEIYKYTKHSCNKIHLFVFSNKKVIVKFTERKKEEILFEAYLVDLFKNGVDLPKILMAKDNLPYIIYGKEKVILNEFIPGEKANFENLENDVINLLKVTYLNKEKISKEYKRLLPAQFKTQLAGLSKKDLDLIKDEKIKNYLEDNWGLIEKRYNKKDDFVPAFKGLQMVLANNKNYFLGTEHLFELYVPIYQAIANYAVNLIFLTGKNNFEYLIKKFLSVLNFEPTKEQMDLVNLLLLVQYINLLKNKNLEDKKLFKIWSQLINLIKDNE